MVSLGLTYQVRVRIMTLASTVFKKISHFNAIGNKELRALRGYFGPPMRQKMKLAFHQILLIGLLGQ